MTSLKAKDHSIVIGGSSGIGRALALHLSETGNVSALARRTDKLVELTDHNHKNIFALTCDVGSPDNIQCALQKCVEHYGKVDKLIYCAGKQIIKPHRMMTVNDIDSLYEVNLRGALFASKIFCSAKISKKNAVFCAISSIAGTRPESGIVDYSVMKAALNTMIRGLAKESAPRRFVGVAPGWLDTEMTRNQPIYGDAFKISQQKNSPLGLTTVNDVVNAVAFLLSPHASSITGQILCVDSGSSL